MTIKWRLKGYLAARYDIFKIKDFQKQIIDNSGIIISQQHLTNLVNKRPKSIKLSTIEIICTGLDCNLSDFCDIGPSRVALKNKKKKRKLSKPTTTFSKKDLTDFPDPNDY